MATTYERGSPPVLAGLPGAATARTSPVAAASRRDVAARPALLTVQGAWVAALLIPVWAAFVVNDLTLAAGIAAMSALAAATWTIQHRRVESGTVDVGAAYGAAGLVSIGALGTSAVIAGTAVSPVLLLLPLNVYVLAVVSGERNFVRTALAVALAATAGVALRSIFGLDEAVAGSISLTAAAALLSIGAFYVGGTDRRRETGTAPVPIPFHSNGFASEDSLEHQLEAARGSRDAVRIGASYVRAAGGATYVSIAENIPDTGILVPLIELGAHELQAETLRTGLNTLSHEAMAAGRSRRLIDDGKDLDAVACRRLGVKALLIVPLRRFGDSVGVIQVAWSGITTERDVDRSLQAAGELSGWITPELAISRVAHELERGYLGAMRAVSTSIEARESGIKGHARRVALIALDIAERIGLSEREQRQLAYAAEMHELGRLGISDKILAKSASLTDEEWSAVRMIPALSAEIIAPVAFLSEVHHIVRHMRERWDGYGYPDGVPGNHIPVLSRILAIADAFDSMVSPRPYREALDEDAALRQLWIERGSAYDPTIVELFVGSRAEQPIATA